MEQTQTEPFKVSRIQISPAISYLMNNLSLSDKYVAYYNNAEPPKICIQNLSLEGSLPSVSNLKYIKLQDQPVTDFKYVQLKGVYYLVITQLSEFKIYKEDGSKLLFAFQKSLGKDKQNFKDISELQNYYKSVDVFKTSDNQEAMCIGSSNSEVYFVEQNQNLEFNSYVGIVFTQKKSKIQCISSCKTTNQLIAADTLGNIHIFMTLALKDISYAKQIESTTKNTPINTMDVIDRKQNNPQASNLLVCGDFIGRIVIYCLTEYNQVACINSHVRMVTTLHCNSQRREIVSGSEDTYLNFWKIDDKDNDINLIVSYRLADQIVVGTQYVNEKGDHALVSTLESLEFTVLTAQQ